MTREAVHINTPAALREVMNADFEFSDQQWRAISAPLEPAVVIAGAGSGKTAVMAARVVYLVATGQVEPDEVLGLTFTTKAASELAHRITASLGAAGFGRPDEVLVPGQGTGPGEALDELREPTVATYNAYAAGLLAEHGLRIGHEPDTRVMADASRYQLAARAVARHRDNITLLSDHPETVIGNLLALDAAMSEHLTTPDGVRSFDSRELRAFETALTTSRGKTEINAAISALSRRAELLGLVEGYRGLKADLGLMDFSDQIALTARLVDSHVDVGAAERAKYRIVLLDEYQDTSVAQALMLKRLFGGGHAVMAVGDPNQAIYGWRGASVSNILNFDRDFPPPEGAQPSIYSLTVNRRSDERILEVANHLAKPLLDAYPAVQPLEAKPDAAAGTIRVNVHQTYADELSWLAEQVLATHTAMPEPAWREIGVLTRDNKHAADVFDALTAREIPVEIVGLQGLLRLPEVAEVVATLTLMHDLTANASLLTLLTGPRWAIGPRDLALLGRRAQQLADAGAPRKAEVTLAQQLVDAVTGADPVEITALSDALEDLGELGYSASARQRFELLAEELRQLRKQVGEPLLDLVRRIIDVTGIDIELASSVSPAARARRDNLDLFVKAVAEFQAVDGDVTLPALLAYLTAEDEMGTGLDIATPTEADSVKLLTVHRAKGLEWDAVFCVGVCEEKFPSKQSRSLWVTSPAVIPAPLRGDALDLPQLSGHEKADLVAYRAATNAHEAEEELRLGYVAFTRARHLLSVSSYLWTESRKTPVGPSSYQQSVVDVLAGHGIEPETWHVKPEKSTDNPLQADVVQAAWPVTEKTSEALRRIEAAELVRAVAEQPESDEATPTDLLLASTIDEWDTEIQRLLVEARAERAARVEVPLPSSLSATSLARLRQDPVDFAADLARPMPRPPSHAARFGTRFHAWLEARFGQLSQLNLIDPDELPGRADTGIDDQDDLAEIVSRFEAGEFGQRVPHSVEAPFALVISGQVIRGRIDAVYRDDARAEPEVTDEPAGEPGYLLVDWKTNRVENADPWQLAIYRVAWAELTNTPIDRIRCAFHYVRTGHTVYADDLPGREELEALLDHAAGASDSVS